MCGIVGFISKNSYSSDLIEKMSEKMISRGPDSSGHWSDLERGVHLGHRRLAILDLSSAGHQPMHSRCERFVLIFNGEIYNHLELREHFQQMNWRGNSDSETLLACLANWGLEKTLENLVGMFAFALWDREEQTLTIARDRMGEKPLYYGLQGETFFFSSELKALQVHPEFKNTVSRDVLSLFLRHNYVPSPYSIYENIFKLEAGHFLQFKTGQPTKPQSKAYWSLNEVIQNAEPINEDENTCIDLLEEKLKKSIKGQMLSDVELGAFLSGGIDSSTIVALMQAQNSRPIKTFTIGFHEKGFNEAEHAKAVANHLKTDHTELYVTSKDALEVVPKLSSIYCEPFADSSQIPTFLVSQMAKKHVTVSLSGDGGDELLGGYNRHQVAPNLWRKSKKLPLPMRKLLSSSMRTLSPAQWNQFADIFAPLTPKKLQFRSPGEKAYKLASILSAPNEEEIYRRLVSMWTNPTEAIKKSVEPTTLLTNREAWPKTDSFEDWMMAMDTLTYMPDDILVKVDRAAMANSLEARVPFLDHRIVEFAWRLPLEHKIRHGQGKWILRQVLYRHVPKELIERPKVGFGIPLGEWLRGPLRDWAEDLLDEKKLREEGFFESKVIRKIWDEHLNQKNDWNYHLWSILMFQAWQNQWQKNF